jgi:hypothetical protein
LVQINDTPFLLEVEGHIVELTRVEVESAESE